jgi:formylglycine-generating enzyme required for sulfatase activity
MKKLGYLLLLIPLLFAFGKNKKPQHSKYLTKHYVKVTAGYVYTNIDAGAVDFSSLNPIKDSLSEFYISSGEITNINWKECLMYLKQEGRMDEYKANVLDTTVWNKELNHTEPFVSYYYQHPAYKDYPAVGMTLKQAQAYANWLTEIFALKNQGVKITFTVPTKLQWIRAARGEKIKQYAWDGKYLRNSKGNYEANFRGYGDEYVTKKMGKLEVVYNDDRSSWTTNDKVGTITAPANSYYPNQFGVYNMCGNVAELVSDDSVAMGGSWNDTGYDVRVESEQPATVPKSTIGFRVVAVIEKLSTH